MRAMLLLAIVLPAELLSQSGTVDADSLPVYSKASATSPVRGTLTRGDAVTINMVLQTNRGNWCDVSSAVSGYVECGRLKQEPVEEILRRAGTTPDSGALVNEAVRLSGFTQEAGAIADPAFLSRIHDAISGSRLTPQQSAEALRVIQQVFTLEKLMTAVRARLRAGHSPEELYTVIDRLQSPVARRMIQLEVQVQPPQLDPKSIEAFGVQLSKTPPAAARLNLIQRVGRAQGVLNSSIDQIAALFRGMMLAWNLTPQQAEVEMQRAMKEMPADIRNVIDTQETLMALYAYRSVSDADLTEYAVFLESRPVQWFYRDLRQGMLDFVQQAGSEIVVLGRIPPPSR